jgi:hypothetical protein
MPTGYTPFSSDGKIKVTYVATLAAPNAPSAAALTAGTELSQYITADGLETPADQNNVDVAVLADAVNAQVVGSYGGVLNITGVRALADADDDLWNLCVYGLVGFVVVRRGLSAAAAWAAAQKAEVYPMQFHKPVMDAPGRDTIATFTVACPVTGDWYEKATLAA